MWFRLSGSSGNTANSVDASVAAAALIAAESNTAAPPAAEMSKFQKFRRSSFRRKQTPPHLQTQQQQTQDPTANLLKPQKPLRRRSKSPHALLSAERAACMQLTETNEENEEQNELMESKQLPVNESDKSNGEQCNNAGNSEVYRSVLSIPLSVFENAKVDEMHNEVKQKNKHNKKQIAKTVKTEQQPVSKRKAFYKSFRSNRRQSSTEDEHDEQKQNSIINKNNNNNNNNKETMPIIVTEQLLYERIENADADGSDDDDDDESDTSSSSSSSTESDDNDDDDNEVRRVASKEKILLTDPKYKNNRIEKSSSKTKINDGVFHQRRESLKRSRSSRKIPLSIAVAAATAAQSTTDKVGAAESNKKKNANKKDKNTEKDDSTASAGGAKPKHTRTHSNLNLQALVKFVMNNKKFLNTDDFALIRRKSLAEAASTVMSGAAVRPRPIALRFASQEHPATGCGVVAAVPNYCDSAKTDKNVVLVKKQNLKNSFCDCGGVNKNQKHINNSSVSKVQRNGSNSSKSSGNFEDEAFYSFDEQEANKYAEDIETIGSMTPTTTAPPAAAAAAASIAKQQPQLVTKASSPSLTSRVAAKINETTNIYKNRKAANKSAKKRNKAALAHNGAGKRAELYKQISVERVHASSIVRQPSDRRPDANISLRSNGNAAANSSALNSSDLQSSFHATSANDSVSAADSSCSGVATSAGGTPTIAGGAAVTAGGLLPPGSDINALDAAENKDARRERYHQHPQHKSAPVSVNRSESYKERLSNKRNRNSRRKTSDPSLTSRPNDDQPDLGLSNSNYTASSNSSLSSGGGSESPSTSMEQVGVGGATVVSGAGATVGMSTSAVNAWHAAAASGHHHHHHHHQHQHSDSFHGSVGSAGSATTANFMANAVGGHPLLRQGNFESDDEDDLNETDWSSMVAAEMLSALTDAEKKRQEIINEIYQTERSHVRTLKLLNRLFFCPLYESNLLSQEHLLLLFPPALLTLLDLHGNFERKLKQRRIEHNHIVNHIGDLLAGMFDGRSGEELCECAAEFCARQQIALEALKEKRRKDEQLQKLLSKAESHKACRRLQLKDLLPTVLQRLTKYPLLFENLYKVTIRVVPENTTEAEAIQRAFESSKRILVEVNQAVKTAEDAHKLQNIQRKLDKSTFDKDEFIKNLDLTQYRLIHDGNLTMKKNPSIQLHGLLFENMIVLLTKQDDKYVLKNLHVPLSVNNKPVNPIMSIDSETLVRQEAADKSSFFLIKTRTSQMLELRAPSSSQCATWFKHISDAAEQYKPRSKNANSNHEPVDDPAIATIPHSNTKESLELTPERPAPQTATMSTTPLAPMLPVATVTPAPAFSGTNNNNNNFNDVQLRNGRRESTPTSSHTNISLSAASSSDSGGYYNLGKQRLSHNELGSVSSSSLAPSVNRTMSTRSCGEANNNYGADTVNLRHSHSARQANGSEDAAAQQQLAAGGYNLIGGPSKRDSASIICSNNSNNTRTLLMQSPLVDPTAIQISISPAHTAEPVLTPSERLRRLDASIRDSLLEKQKIICDRFRLPVEHFNEIVDIAMMPEAPKDSADIALAAYDQVQTLTKVLNEYMQVTSEQEISAVSTSVCDHCHDKQQHQQHQHQHQHRRANGSATRAASPPPPPLPPPNKQNKSSKPITAKTTSNDAGTTPTPATTGAGAATTPTIPAVGTAAAAVNIHEDDDGYCEIDELRLPAVPIAAAGSKPNTPLAPFKVPAPPAAVATPQTPTTTSTTVAATPAAAAAAVTPAVSTTPELIKRQSTISADSIPEESADEVTKAMVDDVAEQSQSQNDVTPTQSAVCINEENDSKPEMECKSIAAEAKTATEPDVEQQNNENASLEKANEAAETAAAECNTHVEQQQQVEDVANQSTGAVDELEQPKKQAAANDQQKENEEHIEINDVYDSLAAQNKAQVMLSMIDNSTQTAQALHLPVLTTSNKLANGIGTNTTAGGVGLGGGTTCGPNRLQHASSLEPSVPCYALSSIVSTLNEQISMLLLKINERDVERERLRKENQHLRELLSAMHDRQRVEPKGETPTNITAILAAADEAFDDELDGASNTSLTPTPTPMPSTPTASNSSGLITGQEDQEQEQSETVNKIKINDEDETDK